MKNGISFGISARLFHICYNLRKLLNAVHGLYQIGPNQVVMVMSRDVCGLFQVYTYGRVVYELCILAP